MYKYGKIVALASTVGWLAFTYSAFKGFAFWYAGFVFFFWLALGAMNYHHYTSLWLLRNRPYKLILFYLIMLVLAILADFVVFQKIVNLWSYPQYNSWDDWVRLYTVIYPFGGLAVLELIYFLASVFREPLRFDVRELHFEHWIIDHLDLWLLLALFLSPISVVFIDIPALTSLMLVGLFVWGIIATWKLKYHIRHWLHYVSIITAAYIMSIFLHEIPNTAVFEWLYNDAPFWNQSIIGVPLYIIFGWYILALMMLRLWIYFVLRKKLT